MMQDQLMDGFTPEAANRWAEIPEQAQEAVLANVFCGTCLGSVRIVIESAEMKGRDLILKGKCATCGKPVGRVIEPDDE